MSICAEKCAKKRAFVPHCNTMEKELEKRKLRERAIALFMSPFECGGAAESVIQTLLPGLCSQKKSHFCKFFGIELEEFQFYFDELKRFIECVYPELLWEEERMDVWIRGGIGTIKGVKFLSLFKNEMKGKSPDNPPRFGLVQILTNILNRTKVLPIAKLYSEITHKCVCSNKNLIPDIRHIWEEDLEHMVQPSCCRHCFSEEDD